MIWLKQWIRKLNKLKVGVLNTYVRKVGVGYSATNWWDTTFYAAGLKSDASTISARTSMVVSKYHYASVELQILKYFFNHNIEISGAKVCDIGSGAGHWLDFYYQLNAAKLVGMDVSKASIDYLQKKYESNPNIAVFNRKAVDGLGELDESFDVVNAIGVMFHIVDDIEWGKTIQVIYNALKDGGVFVVGGHFGLLDNLNVQMDSKFQVNKRLRSKNHWMRMLKNAGFQLVEIKRNYAYLGIDWPLPENHILIASK